VSIRHSAMNNKKLNNIDEILELEENGLYHMEKRSLMNCDTPLHYIDGIYLIQKNKEELR